MADWLVARNVFSKYQTTVLLAGHAGPFVYGDYKIYDRVETGRLANTFRAVHNTAGHPVQLQFMAGPVVQDARLWAQVATEVQVACSLIHPQVQRFFELVDLGSFKFVVGEDMRGETLEERLAVGRIPPHEVCRYARCIALGLAAMHATGRPHGDLRPLNIWLEPATPHSPENAKLLRESWVVPAPLNFAADDAHGQLLARSEYLAPEFQMPGKMPDHLTDLYALGCTMYQMLAGHPPFPGGNAMQKMSRHAMEAIRPLESYGVPQPIAQLVTYLMAKNPSLRYQDAQTVADQLAAFVDPQLLHLPTAAPLPTLPAYEAALKQTHAKLAAQNYQNAFGGTAPAGSIPTGQVAGQIPTGQAVVATGTIPAGKAVGSESPVIAAKTGSTASFGGAPSKLDPAALAAAREAKEKRKLIITLSSIGGGLILLILLFNFMGKGTKPDTAENTDPLTQDKDKVVNTKLPEQPPEIVELRGVENEMPTNIKPPMKTETKPAETPSEAGLEVLADDGKLLWASPTSGGPVDLQYVPPGAGMYLVVRAADLVASKEGPRVLEALGPQFQAELASWTNATQTKLEQIERLILTLHDNEGNFPRVATVVHFKAPASTEELQARCATFSEKKEQDKSYYVDTTGRAYYIPATGAGKVFVTGDEIEIKGVIESPNPLLRTEMSQLKAKSDANRHVNLLFYPSFVFSGNSDPLFANDRQRVKEPLQWLLGDGLQAGYVSMHFGDQFYYEMRYQTKVDKEPRKLAEEFRTRLSEVPQNMLNYFAERLNPPPYWRKLSFKFPDMISKLHESMRIGVEDNQAVVNAVLPGIAAHNLVLGTELAISTSPGAGAVANAPAGNASPYKTMEEVMAKLPIKNFSFDQESLEKTVELLEKEIKGNLPGAPFDFTIRILGKDLQLNGITRNMSIRDFKQENKTAGEVLTAIVRKANPITTVKDPSEIDQQLVWVVGKDPDDGKMRVLVTTRGGVDRNKYTLPDVFKPK
jgi:hypothetical protein